MKTPIFVRSLSEDERESLQKGLRSTDTFTMRRSQILSASSRGERAPRIALNLGCASQTVRDAIHDFNERGLDALDAKSSRPKKTRDAFDRKSAEALREMLHRSPREFGYESSLWRTLDMAAEAAREATGLALPPGERALHEPYLDSARLELGKAAWEEALDEGRSMALEEAAEYALAKDGIDRSTTPVQEQIPAGEPI